ncbi:MAG: hypothetical protein KC731_05995 [Myxococcales bacterium]|nr:hypothetical protein [Myxococcales bacterium]
MSDDASLEAIRAERDALREELDRLLYVLSHDLRAPLRAVKNLALWVGEDADSLPEEATDHLEMMIARIDHMDAMLVGLLEVSRVGRNDGAIDEVDVKQALTDVVAGLEVPEGFQIDIGEMPTVTTCRRRFEQVFHHLLENAIIHHDKKDGRVSVRAVAIEGGHRFVVEDDGPSIPEKSYAKALEPLRSLRHSRDQPRVGIGLALVKRVVEFHGGELELSPASEDGRGLRVAFTWAPGWPVV